MFSRVAMVGVTASVFAWAPLAQAADLPAATAPGALAPPVSSVDQMTKEQFRQMLKAAPDGQVFEFRGQQTTAGALRAIIWQKHKEALAKAQAHAGEARARFEARRAQFLQAQQAKLQADNARIRTEFARLHGAQSTAVVLSPQHQAIQQEAIQLLHRAKTAPPAEQVHIERRAGELLQQLQQLQQSQPPH